jgi:hypothetical protein
LDSAIRNPASTMKNDPVCFDHKLMLASLLARWQASPALPGVALRGEIDCLQEAHAELLRELGPFAPWLTKDEAGALRYLLQVNEADEFRASYGRCFDLMVRCRGIARAVLTMHKLHGLLRERAAPLGLALGTPCIMSS